MGRSLRRAKKSRPKVSFKGKKTKHVKAKLPLEITSNRPDIPAKLGITPTWDTLQTFPNNYKNMGFLDNPNAGFGRNVNEHPLEEQEFSDHDPVNPDDDELRAAINLERKEHKAPPPKLTAQQKTVIERLIAAHGDNVEAMAKDSKLNKFLLPASKLHKLIVSYHYGSAHAFRAPIKHGRHH